LADEKAPSKRALRLWQRLSEWYGSRFVQSYGEIPPRDWANLADRSSDDDLIRALAALKQRHPSHPPTLMEFEVLLRKPKRPEEQPPSVQDLLTKHVFRTRTLTPAQYRGWTWLHAGKAWSQEGAPVTGVVIPPDGDAPGYTVTVAEMERAPA
jgi:hypothetical protein